jgi:hypothetical protein
MDYTIVGGAVKLASRLDHGAPPGGVLISYKTHAQVKDEIYCEEHGPIRVKGCSWPAIYSALTWRAPWRLGVAAAVSLLPEPAREWFGRRAAKGSWLKGHRNANLL